MAARTYYEILNISYEASEAEIRRAYRLAVQKHHPDQNPDSRSSAKRIRHLNAAREILLNPELRKKYNAKLRRRGLIPEADTLEKAEKPNPQRQEPDGAFSFTNQGKTKRGEFPPSNTQSNTTQKTKPDWKADSNQEQNPSIGKWTHPGKLVFMLTLLPLGSIAGAATAFLILWSAFGQDPLGVFPDDSSSTDVQSEIKPRKEQAKINPPKTLRNRRIQGSTAPWSTNTKPENTKKSAKSRSQLSQNATRRLKDLPYTPRVLKTQFPLELLRFQGDAQRVFVSGKCELLNILGNGNQIFVEQMNEGSVIVIGNDNHLHIRGTVESFFVEGNSTRLEVEELVKIDAKGKGLSLFYVKADAPEPSSGLTLKERLKVDSRFKGKFTTVQQIAALPAPPFEIPDQWKAPSTNTNEERTGAPESINSGSKKWNDRLLKSALGGSLAQLEFQSPPQIATLAVGTAIHSDRDSVWSKVPPELEGLRVTQWKCLRGYADVNVTSPGFVIMATSPRWGGGGVLDGIWENELTTEQELLNDGWVRLTTLEEETLDPQNPMRWPVFAKEFQGGEKLRLRTEKYSAPRFFFRAY